MDGKQRPTVDLGNGAMIVGHQAVIVIHSTHGDQPRLSDPQAEDGQVRQSQKGHLDEAILQVVLMWGGPHRVRLIRANYRQSRDWLSSGKDFIVWRETVS